MAQSLKEQYADWISEAIANGSSDLKTFEQWQHIKFQDKPGVFNIMLVSEVLQGVVTLKVPADSKHEAMQKAKKILADTEYRYTMERDSKSGKQLSPEEIRAKAIATAQRFLEAQERRRQGEIKKAMKYIGQ